MHLDEMINSIFFVCVYACGILLEAMIYHIVMCEGEHTKSM